MKQQLMTFKTGVVLLVTTLSFGGLMAQTGYDCLPMLDPDCGAETTLYAAQDIDVGKVVVQSNSSEICVTYLLNEDALDSGVLIYEVHLAVSTNKEGIPQTQGNKWGTNPIPGQFPDSKSFEEGVPCYHFCFSLSDLGVGPGDSVYIAAHAVVGFDDEAFGFVTETAWGEGERFNERGNWGMYFTYELCDSVIQQSYIGYEDRDTDEDTDFDYNDFGMDFGVQEFYVGTVLERIEMTFIARTNLAADKHDIHIKRLLKGDYTYTVIRDDAAMGAEVGAVTDESESGDFDVVVFDTARWGNVAEVGGSTVQIVIEIDEANVQNTIFDEGPAPRFDLDPTFSLYDPYMVNRTKSNTVSIADMRLAVDPLPLLPDPQAYSVPNILVVPEANWDHPEEANTITNLYPDFFDYYSTQDPAYANWWDL